MKRSFVLTMVLGLLVGSIATAEAGKKKKAPPAPVKVERVVEFPYSCPCGPRVMGYGAGFQLGSQTGENIGGGAVAFDPTTENFLRAETTDNMGQSVAIRISMDTDPEDTSVNNTVADICSSTPEPIEMPDVEAEFRVFISFGTCADGTPSMPTQGTVTFTLSNIP